MFRYRKKVIEPLPSCELYDLCIVMNWQAVELHAKIHPKDGSYQDYDGRDGGCTPLYIACEYNAPLGAVQGLLDAYPEATRIKNRNGNIPLHVACHCGASLEVLQALVTSDPFTTVLQTKWGKTPLNALYDGCNFSGIQILEDTIMAKVEVLLKSVAMADKLRNNKDGCLLLHAAVSLGAMGCPHMFFKMILAKYPHHVFERDPLGRLPMHVAVGPCKWYLPKLSRKYKPRERDIIDALLLRNSAAARIPDQVGRLPLHSALANGHLWDGGVESLFHAAPEVISMKDPVTGLVPFMLAAVPVGETSPSLTTIFCLLSSEPHLLLFYITNGANKEDNNIEAATCSAHGIHKSPCLENIVIVFGLVAMAMIWADVSKARKL